MSQPGRVDARLLSGVSETALFTLRGRAYQAGRPDAIIDDPMAVRLVESIDFDFDKFGRRKGQEMALSPRRLAQLADTVPGIRAVHDVPMPEGRGWFFGTAYPALWQFPPVKPFRGAYTLLEFG